MLPEYAFSHESRCYENIFLIRILRKSCVKKCVSNFVDGCAWSRDGSIVEEKLGSGLTKKFIQT